MHKTEVYQPNNKIRFVTATSLFDGHDVAINMLRRMIQSSGAEVIHLGHNRSVGEIVDCAIQEDVNAIAVSSYQGGHNEYFRYMYDLLQEKGAGHIRILGGGGGVILPDEIKALTDYGITRLYSSDDGMEMGLQGMVNDMVMKADFPLETNIVFDIQTLQSKDIKIISRMISIAENFPEEFKHIYPQIKDYCLKSHSITLGITGTGGAGKSSLVDELVNRFLNDFSDKTIAIISVDPTKRKSGGALLGDRIRMNSINDSRVYMRSLATRQSNLALSKHIQEALDIVKVAEFDLIILETSGIGQSDTEITEYCDLSLYVMTPEYGAASQLEKIDMLDFADIIAINKFDKRGAEDSLRDVKKQYRRNHNLFDEADEKLPIFGTMASRFNDIGTNNLYLATLKKINEKLALNLVSKLKFAEEDKALQYIIPPKRTRYLSEIVDCTRNYNGWANEQSEIADKLYGITRTLNALNEVCLENIDQIKSDLDKLYEEVGVNLDSQNKKIIEAWYDTIGKYKRDVYSYTVRDKQIDVKTYSETLSHTKIPKICVPKFRSWGDILKWSLQENFPGHFPFTAGVFPFKREGEDPTRMFAGEGGPERTNKRFHYVSRGMPAKRLSTAFDSITLYGENPDERPDIYGRIGNAGVSICCLDDLKKLYSGFRLTDPKTSVSMTVNGPAPILMGYFMNAAIDQECEIYIRENCLESNVERYIKDSYTSVGADIPKYNGDLPEGNDGLGLMLLGGTGDQVLPRDVYEKIKSCTIANVRGTVQADILKEDQSQNTCIFSTEFAIKLMGDVQEYFINNNVRNFYSASISGYHIAEAGANPITQLAFTLANGFTFVEYYLSRGMDINHFAPNLSFFFSNGIDPEYAVIGRVARRIWAKAMKNLYKANSRSQMLKYHIQTSGRSLHAQEIDFNDIRTTLQALYAIYDNCNSLHTNAYDEAITTPTEQSVRRALAIQLIINNELGLAKNQNPLQGSFVIEELTDLIEEAVMAEFERISERGGVLGAMETMYQRSKIQEESYYYEKLKHSGEYPIVGVNTFISPNGVKMIAPTEVIRATEEEKKWQIQTLQNLHTRYSGTALSKLSVLQDAVRNNKNVFENIMETSKYCSLGQISNALYRVGGQYRRNM